MFPSSKDADLREYAQVLRLFQTLRPTHVIHLAAAVGGLFKNMRVPVDMYESNVAINGNVLRAAHVCGVIKVVSLLSTCIFPDAIAYPIDESMLHAGPPHASNAPYAYAKRGLDVLSRAYNTQFPGGCKFVCGIPTNVYGPADNYSLEDGHVIPALIHRCALAKREGVAFVVAGTGAPLRQFIHSADLAALLVWMLHNYEDAAPLILAPGEEVSIGDVARAIAAGTGFAGELRFDTSKADGQFKKTVSSAKLKSLVPGLALRPIVAGIADACVWFADNEALARK